VGGQHRLGVLMFMLDDEAVDEAVGEQLGPTARPPAGQMGRVGRVQVGRGEGAQLGQRSVPNVSDIPTGLRRREQRQRGPVGPRMPECVVEIVDSGPQLVRAGERPQQPQLLVVAHVRQVPHQRRHQRRMLA
jgi:hypothetical protein